MPFVCSDSWTLYVIFAYYVMQILICISCFTKSCFFKSIFNFANAAIQKKLLLDKTEIIKSSHPEVLLGKCVLKICSKFTGEHPWWSVISIKLLCNFIEIKLCHGCSPVNLQHIFRTPFPKNTSGGLLLYPATSQKKRTPRRVFPDEFCEVLKTPFLTALGNYFCSTEKYFTNKIVKNSLRKKELKKKKNGSSL